MARLKETGEPDDARSRGALLAALMIAVFFGLSVFWTAYDGRLPPVSQDCVRHTLNAARHLPDVSEFTVATINHIQHLDVYPPAHSTVLAVLFRILGTSIKISQLFSAAMFALLLACTYLISRRILPDDGRPHLMAVFILGCFPAVFASSHYDNLSMMLSLAVTVSVWLLLMTDGFVKTGWAAALGLALGMGLLVKWTFPVFVVGPILLTLILGCKEGQTGRKLRNASIAVLIAAAVSGPWYVGHLREVIELHRFNVETYQGIYPESPLAPFNLFVYSRILLEGMMPVFAVAVLFGVICAFRKRCRDVPVLLSWLVVPYVVLVFMNPKYQRYVLPLYPAFAILAAAGIGKLGLRVTKFIATAVVVAVGLVCLAQSVLPVDVIASTFKASFFEHKITPLFPSRDAGQVPSVVKAISDDWGKEKELCYVAVAPKLPSLHQLYCNYEALIVQRRKMLFVSLEMDDMFSTLAGADYVVARLGPFPDMTVEADMSPHIPSDEQVKRVDEWLSAPPEVFWDNHELLASLKDAQGESTRVIKLTRKLNLRERLRLLDALSGVFRKPELEEIQRRRLYRSAGWYSKSLKIWKLLEAKGQNCSWTKTPVTDDLVDVVEAEDMLHNVGADIFAGRSVRGGWKVLRPSKQIALVRLPGGSTVFELVARAGPDCVRPNVAVSVNSTEMWSGEIGPENPSIVRFEADVTEDDGLLSVAVLEPAHGAALCPVAIDKIVVRKARN